jgi:hypothetical protein
MMTSPKNKPSHYYPFNFFADEKPNWWAAVFHAYVHLSVFVFGAGAVQAVNQAPAPGTAALYTLGFLAVLVPAFKTVAGLINKGIKTAPKKN